MNFKIRSYQAELLDNEDIPQEDLYQNLRELDFINRTLGGHSVVLDGIKYFINSIKIINFNKPVNTIFSDNIESIKHKEISEQFDNKINSEKPNYSKNTNISNTTSYLKNINIFEIGSGGGDNLRAIDKYLQAKIIPHKLGGVDLKEDCVRFSENFEPNSSTISYQIADYQLATFPDGKPDIIFNSLFCHHFKDEELVKMLRWMHKNSAIGFIIADLHRHWLAYYSIKILTKLFSKSYLVKNDAPLSVLRGFSRQEWVVLLEKAEIKNYKIRWKWAFRWLILVEKEA
jgi:hypothetical protein